MKNVEDILPLTPMQQLMLMHSLSMAGASTLSNQFHYRITGTLNVERFRAAWQGLVDRHAALRTGFAWEGVREPVQIVRQTLNQVFRHEDLRDMTESERATALAVLQEFDQKTNFDLRKAPLSRVVLLSLTDDEHIMLWTRHHLVLDRWCVDILFNELFHLYRVGADSGLPPAGRFRHYMAWLAQQDAKEAESYWREYLKGTQASLIVSCNVSDGEVVDEGLSNQDSVLSVSLYASIRALGQSLRISQAVLFQGAVALLLARYCQQHDVTFGMTVSGRPAALAGVENTMGSFINNVPVHQRFDPEALVSEWLRALHAGQATRFRYEHVSPIDLHRWSELPASVPLFDVLLLMHSPATEVRHDDDIRIEQLDGPLESTFPLTLALADNAGRLEINVLYDSAHLNSEAVGVLLADLQEILSQMVDAPTAPLKTLLPHTVRVADHSRTGSTPTVNALQDPVSALQEIWRSTLGLQHVGLDDDFFALGGSSVQAALLISHIERQFGKVLPLSVLFNAGSVREFLALLDAPIPRTSPLVTIQSRGKRAPLYIVPGIGGNVVGLAGLARALGPNQPLYGLQSVGLDGQEDPEESIENIAARYLHEMEPVKCNVILFGICWGAAVAFEMAQQMMAAGHAPARLVVMDPVYHEPPAGARPKAVKRGGRIRDLLSFAGGRLSLYAKEFRGLQGSARREWLKSKLDLVVSIVRTGDAFRGDRTEFNQRRVTDANLQALQNYRPEPYSGHTIVLFTVDRKTDSASDPRRPWLQFVPAATSVLHISGRDTGDALSPQHVSELARVLKRALI